MPIFSLIAALAFLVTCIATDAPVVSYVTRPDISAPNLIFTAFERNKVTGLSADRVKGLEPGYYFLSTWKGTAQHAPYIFDNEGNLIWSGYDNSLSNIGYFDFQTHHLSNSTSLLSVFRGYSDAGRGKGHVAFLDQKYEVYRTIQTTSPMTSLDLHAFYLSENGRTAIVTSYQPIQADLTAYGINETLGWLLDSVIYTIDLSHGNTILSEWRSSDHIHLNESAVTASTDVGAGLSYGYAFDCFHLNSIALFQNGDYLLSARHTNTLYRISSSTGEVLWRLGGKNSSFVQNRFTFSSQHDARILHETPDGTIILSLFNNAHNGISGTNTSSTSSALVLSLDTRAMTAYPVEQYFPPPTPSGNALSRALGSLQSLPNGNNLVSWGYLNTITEFSPSGHPLLNIAFADEDTAHYRVHKGNWTAYPPVSELILYAYAPNTSLNTHVYISWNGATQVQAWRIYGTILTGLEGHADGGPEDEVGVFLGQIDKTGFETHFDAKRFVTSAWVHGIDEEWNVLGKSDVMRTIVPREEVRERCGETHCVRQILMQGKEWDEQVSGPICVSRGEGQGYGGATMGGWAYVQTGLFFLLGIVANRVFMSRARKWWRW